MVDILFWKRHSLLWDSESASSVVVPFHHRDLHDIKHQMCWLNSELTFLDISISSMVSSANDLSSLRGSPS